MLSAPGQPVRVRTQGLFGWERVGRSLGEGISDVLKGSARLLGLEQKVNSAGELASFSEQLRGISAEVGEELAEAEEVKDWDYAWNAAASPRIAEAVQGLSVASRESAMELARAYSAQASIEARRDRDVKRIATARGRWEQQLESSVSAGQEEQAARWLEAGRGVFVPEAEMDRRLDEVRSRACRSRWESRLQAAPLETLTELASARGGQGGTLPTRKEDKLGLNQSQERTRRQLRRELAQGFSENLRAGEEPEPTTLRLAAKAGILPSSPQAGKGISDTPDATTRSVWRRWLDTREEGEDAELDARLALAAAPLPLAERQTLLARLERSAQVPAADRRAFSHRLFGLYNAGVFGCPSDAEAQRCFLSLQDEGATLLAEQGAEAVSDWLEARRAGGDRWVCFEPGESRRREGLEGRRN